MESPRVDAELLLAHVLGTGRAALLTRDDVTDDDAARFTALVEQRADRVPLQHLTGRAPFRHLELAVGPGVFVPRPETEQLAGWAIARLAGLDQPVERPARQLLGLRPRDEDAKADRELQVTERRPAGEVLQRDAVGALVEQRREPGGILVPDVVPGQQCGAGRAEDVGEQQLGVHPRRLHAGRGEPAAGVREQRARVQEAASSSAVCARSSASMTASRSPSSTWSRL